MGPCGLVGSLLLDVFGFEDDAIFRLQGGFDALKPLLDSGAEDGVSIESALNARKALAAAKKAQREADATLARAKADLVVYDAASREHLDVLAKGTWATEDAARDHLSQFSPLLKPLKLESSLLAMLNNAAMKKPAQRGPFDAMVFSELSKRFAEKLTSLQEEVASAAKEVSEQAAAVKAAQAEVDETRRVCGSPSKPTKSRSEGFAERIEALKSAAAKAAAEKLAAEKAAGEKVAAEMGTEDSNKRRRKLWISGVVANESSAIETEQATEEVVTMEDVEEALAADEEQGEESGEDAD